MAAAQRSFAGTRGGIGRVFFLTVVAVVLGIREANSMGIHKELYTTNAVCRKRFCINPIFPTMENFAGLADKSWVCQDTGQVRSHLSFCADHVTWAPAVPAPPDNSSRPLGDIVREQEQLAMTHYFYHLSGMGIDPWDFPVPSDTPDACTQSVWRIACSTFFPQCEQGVGTGNATAYLKPCRTCCENYISSCGVECCDESVQCTFELAAEIEGSGMTKLGFSPHSGPSLLCTGSAFKVRPSWLAALAVALVVASVVDRRVFMCLVALGIALMFVGCDSDGDIPGHTRGNWQMQSDYLEVAAEGRKLNSCTFTSLASAAQCSNRGVCSPLDPTDLSNPLAFCKCDRDWADPECGTLRKSQVTAFMLSLFLGPLGVDQFYLGYPLVGAAKLATLGGLGVWWIIDVVRIGSAPVYARRFRVANDLPHWAFVVTSVSFMFLLGFALVFRSTSMFIAKKRKDAMMLQAEEEALLLQADYPAYSAAGPLPPNVAQPGGPAYDFSGHPQA